MTTYSPGITVTVDSHRTRGSSGFNQSALPTAIRPVSVITRSRSLSSSLSLPASSRTALFRISFPCFLSKRESPLRFPASLRVPRNPGFQVLTRLARVPARILPPAGLGDAFTDVPRRPARVRGSHSQRLRRWGFAPPTRRRPGRLRAPLVTSRLLPGPHSFSPSGMAGSGES